MFFEVVHFHLNHLKAPLVHYVFCDLVDGFSFHIFFRLFVSIGPSNTLACAMPYSLYDTVKVCIYSVLFTD